jgi:hypothetical protein
MMPIPDENEAARSARGSAILLALVLIVMFVSRLGAYDLWWHLTAGREILATMSVPRVDIFSFTAAGRPWVYHSWLGGILLHLVHAATGLTGLILIRCVAISASLLLSWVAARRRGAVTGLAAILTLVCAFQFGGRALTRPYVFSFVFFIRPILISNRSREMLIAASCRLR